MITQRRNGRSSGAPRPGWRRLPFLVAWLATGVSLSLSLNAFGAEPEQPDNAVLSPRQIYNDGTQKLRTGKLREAETILQSAVSSQDEKVQAASLYNLGHARYLQGKEALAKGPNAEATHATADRAYENGSDAIRGADKALAGDDLEAIVAAYMRGRGARKELKAANEAVKHSMEMFGGVLAKWQRARGDFKSAHELRQSDTDAEANAEAMDRCIAKLVDLQQMMMQSMNGVGKQRSELREKMKALKKKMPKDMGEQLSGKNGEDDDEDEGNKDKKSPEPKPGEREPESKDGKPMMLTQEDAMRLLGMLKLDADRKLPMSMGETGEPKDRKGRDW